MGRGLRLGQRFRLNERVRLGKRLRLGMFGKRFGLDGRFRLRKGFRLSKRFRLNEGFRFGKRFRLGKGFRFGGVKPMRSLSSLGSSKKCTHQALHCRPCITTPCV